MISSSNLGGAICSGAFGAQRKVSIAYARGIGSFLDRDVYFNQPDLPNYFASANSDDTQLISAQATDTYAIYHISYLFLFQATLASILAAVSLLLAFSGFWRIDRLTPTSLVSIFMNYLHNMKMLIAPGTGPAKFMIFQVGERRR